MKIYQIFLPISLAATLPTVVSGAVVRIENYGAPTPSEQASFVLINRFRADPVNELARMFNENFGTNFTNATLGDQLNGKSYESGFWTSFPFNFNLIGSSMNNFETSPDVLFDEFQALTPKAAFSWNNNIGWAAHQYSTRVELNAGANDPHFIPGAPSFGARFSNVGVNISSAGENIAADWPANPAAMHMGLAVDWGTGTNGMQNPRGHRDAMMSDAYTDIGIGTLDAGWGVGRVTQVQHLASLSSPTDRIAYGYVYTDTSATTKASGATVNIYDAANNLLGSATTDSTGAYTYKVASGAAAPATAEYILSGNTSPRHTLGNDGNTWFLDAAVIPEPSSALLAGLTILGACVRRRRVG